LNELHGVGELVTRQYHAYICIQVCIAVECQLIIHGAELNIFYIFLLKLFYMFWLFENIIVIICLELKSKLKT